MEKSSDICLVVEGSYPYVTGGVSSWLQWLMENLKEFSFSIVAFIAEAKDAKKRKYAFPENVVSYQEYVIFDYAEIEGATPLRISKKQWRILSDQLFQLMKDWRAGDVSEQSLSFLRKVIYRQSPNIFKNFLEDEAAFALLTRIYENFRGEAGFVKYFYNFRNIHLILFRLLTIIPKLPEASIYHSPSTGYAGMVACLRSMVDNHKSIITEHGIYLQEREMELLKSDWLDDPYLKDMWIESFSAICRWQYSYSDRIITLFEGNKQLEVEYGAKEDRIKVVPNGIDIERFKGARHPRCASDPKTVGLVGRVDSVKDVKTFIQAMSMIKTDYPRVNGLVIGPTDDQPEYYKECIELINLLNLNEWITFTGRADVLDYYRQMDILLLTSIKEAMPLVVMEAMASGIPVVATDVGACRELLFGAGDDIGPAGIVTRIMDADEIAKATVRLCSDQETANRFAQNGIRRIEKFYREELIIDQYRKIYSEEIDGGHQLSAGQVYS